MTQEMTVTEEMNDLRNQLSELVAQITSVNNEKDRIVKRIVDRKTCVSRLNDEINRRKEFPDMYPVGAGAGTVSDLEDEVEAIEAEISVLEDEAGDFNQPIEDLEESRDQIMFVMADKLKEERTAIGKEMSKHSCLQHEAYETQKDRYKKCKELFEKTNPGVEFKYKFLRQEDRDFIERHKELNEYHKSEWIKLCDQRQELCERIDELDPNDEDLGFDEEEDM
jgi:predicted  nucleic acid-binding Zn-ribbon protein